MKRGDMDQYRADLHVHSKYSRATSKSLNPRHLAAWAGVKGLDVVATGDFTHPAWLAELEEALEEDSGHGLFRLKDSTGISAEIPFFADFSPPGRTRFMLSAEISSIYKRGGKVRKVHNLVYVPSFEAAKKLNAKLARVGNLASDGRPILGLDSRHLLEMVLETDPMAFLVPAHIWTPWFSMFGSKSGFDSVEECFGSLSEHIFALETGLSSDPDMNWLCSSLDRFRLISNSDAHSGEKLGREANLFSGPISFEAMYRALRGEGVGQEFLGTLEFFPEEGKYHLDGHLACGVVMDPGETKAQGGICPVCGKELTIGVLHRVMDLADREEPRRPKGQPGFVSLVPLGEVIAELTGVSETSKKVKERVAKLTAKLGPELSILSDAPLEDLAKDSALLAEAIGRMRSGKAFRQPGYDGQYGRVRLFEPGELARLTRGLHLVDVDLTSPRKSKKKAAGPTFVPLEDDAEAGGSAVLDRSERDRFEDDPLSDRLRTASPLTGSGMEREQKGSGSDEQAKSQPRQTTPFIPIPEPSLNDAQREAAFSSRQHLLVLAGPGTGKTHTLMARVRHLVESGADPAALLVVTFTRRAAGELKDRLGDLASQGVRADTLHALAHEYWTEAYGEKPVLLSEEAARRLYAEVNPELTGPKLKQSWQELSLSRERMQTRLWSSAPNPAEPQTPSARYAKQKASWNLADYTDLLEFWLEKIESGIYINNFQHILIDEIQDLSPLQLAVIHALASDHAEVSVRRGSAALESSHQDSAGASERRGSAGGNPVRDRLQIDPVGIGQAEPRRQTADCAIFAIGDPNQSIYGFRGAVSDAAASLKNFWPDLSIVTLTQNYRSTQAILDLAHGLFPASAALTAARAGESGEIREFVAPQSLREISWMAAKIRQLLGPTSATLTRGSGPVLSPADIAVLTRFRGLMEPIQKMLDRFGVPACVPEAEAFWADSRVKAILNAAGRFLGMAGMEGAFTLACPDRVLAKGPKEIAFYLRDVPPFDHLFWQSAEFTELVKAYAAHGGWAGLISHVNGESELELVGRRSEKVRIMTLHAAKGLEFEAVFLPALEDGILPFKGMGLLTGKPSPADAPPDEAEEERLFYVGLTRAKTMLYLSHAAKRELYGRLLMLKPSRLLKKLDLTALKRSKLVSRTVRKEKRLDLI